MFRCCKFTKHILQQTPGHADAVADESDNPPTDVDLIFCSRCIQEGADLSLLAAALNVPDDEFDTIRHKYKKPQGQALQLMRIWLKEKGRSSSKRKLADVLLSVGFGMQAVDRWAYHGIPCTMTTEITSFIIQY